DLSMHLEKGFVLLQLAEKIRTHAHQHVQARIGNTLRNHLRKPSALALLGAHKQFFALIDVEEKGGGLDPIEVLVTALGLAEQIGKSGFPVRVEQLLDPFVPVLDAGGIASVELPSVKKRLNQRLQRFGSGLQGEETPAAAILKSLRPCAGRARPL